MTNHELVYGHVYEDGIFAFNMPGCMKCDHWTTERVESEHDILIAILRKLYEKQN